jgi:hypothetical protein
MTPEQLSELVDKFYEARELRLEADRKAAVLKKAETEFKDQLIRELTAQKVTSLGGQLARVTLQQKQKPIVTGWADLYVFIKTHDAFDLLQRRLTETAVKARWEDGIVIPGVDVFPVTDLSVAKP